MNKMKYINKIWGIILIGATVMVSSCSENFLEPDPLSFYEPSATFTTEAGLKAALAQADRNMKLYYTTSSDVLLPIATEFVFSDMLVVSATDKQSQISDIANMLVPSTGVYNTANDGARMHSIIHFWNENYAGIKYANTVLDYAPHVTTLSEKIRNEYVGRAYFHRSFRYYAMVHQFGDVPLVSKLVEVPKQNYRSTKREAILQMIEIDMEKAIEWVPEQPVGSYTVGYPGGYINKAACRMLLAKIYMANGKFQEAKAQLDILIDQSGFRLMTEPFGTEVQPAASETWKVERNVIWDLHRGENIYNAANTELILGIPNQGENIVGYTIMRCLSPFVFNGALASPSGRQGLQNYNRRDGKYNAEYDYQRVFGRGVASMRPCTWAQYGLWEVNDKTDEGDLRHSRKAGNWLHMGDLKYNNKDDQEWFGKNLRLFDDEGNLLCNDTIRRWYDIPLYKFYYYDKVQDDNLSSDGFRGAQRGSIGDLYLYRLAEAYLLRAEAKFYINPSDPGIADDVNIIRERAQCEQLYTAGQVTIGDIFDERARELYLEEWRHVELVRASFGLAISGRQDEWGNTYSLDNLTKQSGTDQSGGSYWYQRCIKNNFYNDGITRNVVASGQSSINYTMDKKNMFWPIPEVAITSNNKGKLFQNYGYSGYDESISVWDNWEDAVANEDIIE
ncbi:MAG: RagB/SusD family nutrient uptake outer membrane protein [Tannerellaceae bacterium]|jgi:hypothetical protein|nr:RagB/SusD family nutrient uptake outer membrane protein [Tannerellaceae bacterium]